MNADNILKNVNLGPITSSFFNSCITEAKKEENIDKIKCNVIDPVIDHMVCKLQPYVIGTTLLFVFIIIITILILFLLIKI